MEVYVSWAQIAPSVLGFMSHCWCPMKKQCMKVRIALKYALGSTMLALEPTRTMVYPQPGSLYKLFMV
jgi:hypothetical protein